MTPEVSACICNVEMGAEALLDRQLTRISGIDLTAVRAREFEDSQAGRIDAAMTTIEQVADRLSFVSAPFDLDNVAAVVDDTESDILVLDYIQRIRPPSGGGHKRGDKRGDVDATMGFLRDFAEAGMAVLVVAAVARTKDGKGRSSYDPKGLGLASFRESSELEFGADDAFLLVPHKDDEGLVVLRHLKARHGEPESIDLEFDRPLQRFTAMGGPGAGERAAVKEKVKNAWKKGGPKE